MTLRTEHKVSTYILWLMKEAVQRNRTLLKMPDEIKQENEHNEGLEQLVDSILARVAKQAESLRVVSEQQLEQFMV